MPFDEAFYIKTNANGNNEILKTEFIQGGKSGRLKPVVETRVIDNGKNIIIKVPPLLPGRSYDFLISKKLNGSKLTAFTDVVFTTLAGMSAANEYDALSTSINSNYSKAGPGTYELPDYTTQIRPFVFTDIRPLVQTFITALTGQAVAGVIDVAAEEANTITADLTFANRDAQLTTFLGLINTCDCIEKIGVSKNEDFLRAARNLVGITSGNIRDIKLGKVSIAFKQPTPRANTPELVKRLENLKSTDKIIYEMLSTIEQMLLSMTLTNDQRNDLSPLMTSLNTYRSNLTGVISAHTALAQSIKDNGNSTTLNNIWVNDVEWLSTTSSSNKLTTRVKGRITPDAGIVFFGRNEFSEIRPFYGIHINLRQVNKDIKLKDLDSSTRTLLHRLSVMVGVTGGGAITKEGVRKDLFKNSSLMVGLGVRINHTFRFSFGTVIFQEFDPNPLITETNRAIVPFASLSIDIEISNILGFVSKTLLN